MYFFLLRYFVALHFWYVLCCYRRIIQKKNVFRQERQGEGPARSARQTGKTVSAKPRDKGFKEDLVLLLLLSRKGLDWTQEKQCSVSKTSLEHTTTWATRSVIFIICFYCCFTSIVLFQEEEEERLSRRDEVKVTGRRSLSSLPSAPLSVSAEETLQTLTLLLPGERLPPH